MNDGVNETMHWAVGTSKALFKMFAFVSKI